MDGGVRLVHPDTATAGDWVDPDVVLCDAPDYPALPPRWGTRTGPLFLVGLGPEDRRMMADEYHRGTLAGFACMDVAASRKAMTILTDQLFTDTTTILELLPRAR